MPRMSSPATTVISLQFSRFATWQASSIFSTNASWFFGSFMPGVNPQAVNCAHRDSQLFGELCNLIQSLAMRLVGPELVRPETQARRDALMRSMNGKPREPHFDVHRELRVWRAADFGAIRSRRCFVGSECRIRQSRTS